MKRLHIVIASVLYITILFTGSASPNSKADKLAQPSITAGKELKRDAPKALRSKAQILRLPFAFEENRGQTDARVHFLARAPGHTFFLTGDEVILTRLLPVEGKLKTHATLGKENKGAARLETTRMKIAGAKTDIKPVAEGLQSGKVNYFIGKDPKRWQKDIAAFGQVRYSGVYRNIDLVYHTDRSRIRYDFVVNPGGDPNDIRLVFPDAKRIEVDGTGNLVVTSNGGVVRHSSPRIYQIAKGRTKEVTGGFVVKDGTATFRIGPYNPGLSLIIDPEIVFSSYYGGSGLEGYPFDSGSLSANAFGAFALAVDSQDRLLVTGITMSADLPVTVDSQLSNADPDADVEQWWDAFVLRVSLQDPSAPSFIATYFGGKHCDKANGIAIDSANAIYIAGSTRSDDLPHTEGAFAPTLAGRYAPGLLPMDAFVAKFDENLNVIRTTYLDNISTQARQEAYAVAVDGTGVYVVGSIYDSPYYNDETSLATPGAFQRTHGGYDDGFAAKLSVDLSSLHYYTYLGGNAWDNPLAVAVREGRAYIAGHTNSMDFPVRGDPVVQPSPGVDPGFVSTCSSTVYIKACFDGFVTVLNETGGDVVYSTYLGWRNFDFLRGIAVDADGNAYVVGASDTGLSDYGTDIITAKIYLSDPTGDGSLLHGSLAYMTRLPGPGDDAGTSLVLDTGGNIHVTGWTESDGLASPDAVQEHPAPSTYSQRDAFYAVFDPDGNKTYFSYFGGNGKESGQSIARDSAGAIYIGGSTDSYNLEPVHPIEDGDHLSGYEDIFLVKFTDECMAGQLSLSPKSAPLLAGLNEEMVYTLHFANSSPDPATCISLDDVLPSQVTFVAVDDSRCTYLPGQTRVSCPNLSVRGQSGLTINITVRTTACGTAVNTATLTPFGGNAQTVSASTTICPLPTFTKTQTTPNPAAIGDEVSYGLTINNRTSSPMTAAEVKDTLPQFLQYEGVDISPQNSTITCSFDASTHTLSCQPSGGEPGMSFPPGETTIGIRTKAISCSRADNTAEMRLPNQAPLMSNTVTTTVNRNCPLPLFYKTSEPEPPRDAGVGETVTYSLTIKNDTQSMLTGMRVTDPVPEALRIDEVFGSNCTILPGNIVECSNFDVSPGRTIIDIKTTATACGTFSNKPTLYLPDGRRVVSECETLVNRNCPSPPLVRMGVRPRRAVKGSFVDYLLQIENPLNPLVTRMNVVDEVTSQLQLTGLEPPCTGNDCPYFSDDRHWKLDNMDLLPGTWKEFTISAKAVYCGRAVNHVTLSAPGYPALAETTVTTEVDCPAPLRGENEVCQATAECESPLVCAQTCRLVPGCKWWDILCNLGDDGGYYVCDTDYHCLQPQDESPGFRRKD